jgi:acetyltransferase-like isoleucine patch superfamily enzyme/dTDP-4-dehydrorhamnose 3,5-epimerase-like enzyme
MSERPFIHELSEVQSEQIGNGTRIWQYTVVLGGAIIGEDANINSHCFVENDVVLGKRVTVKAGVQLWDGIRLADDVFVGPNVTFTNDKFPRSKAYPDAFLETRVERGASIGAGAVILPGITIGMGAMIGAGSVVTRSIPAFAKVIGNPARIVGYVNSNAEAGNGRLLDSKELPLPGEPVELGVDKATLHRMKLVRDLRGSLSAGEFAKDIPFTPKRYFLVFDVPSEKTRGEHAHRTCEQFLICVNGSCSVVVDDGRSRREVVLDSPELGLYIPPGVWGIQYKYSRNATLLVFASDYYDSDDYIRNYSEFLTHVGQLA